MKQTQTQVATKDSGVTQATKVEIPAIKDGKKSNPLVGFFKGVKDKFDGFKSAFKQEQGKDENIKTERPLKQEGAKFSEKDIFMDQALWTLWLELLESLFGKKKFAVDNITK